MIKSDWTVPSFSLISLAGPDVVRFFEQMGPVFDGLVRLGQVGVAIATIFYILKKRKTIGSRVRRKKP